MTLWKNGYKTRIWREKSHGKTKPYNGQILLARIQKILARTYEVQANTMLVHKGLTLNLLNVYF